jgi:hypothetical protein
MEGPTITISLLQDSVRDLELVRRLIDEELTRRRSRGPLSGRIVLAPKSSSSKAAARRSSRVPGRSSPKRASPERASPPRTVPGRGSPERGSPPHIAATSRASLPPPAVQSPVKSDSQRAAETVLIADLPEDISEQALLDELSVYGDVVGLEFLRNESDEVLNSARVRFASRDSVDRIVATDLGATPLLQGATVYKARKGLSTVRELDKELEGASVLSTPPSTTRKASTRGRRGGRAGRSRGARQ